MKKIYLVTIVTLVWVYCCIFSVAQGRERSSKTIVIQPSKNHERTLIWMHGLGDSSSGFADVFDPSSQLRFVDAHTKVILPTAPIRSVTVSGGSQMTSWYDIISGDKRLPDDKRISQAQMEDSYKIIANIISEEIALLPSKDSTKIFVGGFSQGSSMSYYVSVKYPQTLGGAIALSGTSFSFNVFDIITDERGKKLELFMGHGEEDTMVQLPYAMTGYNKVLGYFKQAELHKYPKLGHSVSQQVMQDVRIWWQKITQNKNADL